MTIATRAELLAARKLRVSYTKTGMTGSGTFQARGTLFAQAGDPPAGTLSGGSTTAAGVIPTDATTGCPNIPSFGGLTGYLTKMDLGTNNVGRCYWVFDLLWKAGAYTTASNTVVSPPTLTRVPGSDFKGLEIWIEAVVTFVGTAVVTIEYDDENGAPRSVATTLVAAMDAGRTMRVSLPTAGVQRVTRVIEAGATGGTFNVVILRRLTTFLNPLYLAPSNSVGILYPTLDYLGLGFPQVYEDSALYFIADTTNGSRAAGIYLEIAVG
jgi:hypothetical protein